MPESQLARLQSGGDELARINIETSLLTDDRFTNLMIKLGSRTMALGVITEAFILAQKHYLNDDNDRLIPLNEWERKSELHMLLDVGLAEKRELGIYIKGSEENFKWLLQRQSAGKTFSEKKAKQLEQARANKLSKNENKSVENSLNGSERLCTDMNGSEPPYSLLFTQLSKNIYTHQENSPKTNLHPLISLWNEHATVLSKVKSVSKNRLKRIKEVWDKQAPEEWVETIKVINTRSFYIGKNDRGWKASFDYMIRDGKLEEINNYKNEIELKHSKALRADQV